MSKKIKAYKAMNKDTTCRGKQYEVGKTYVEDEADTLYMLKNGEFVEDDDE